jgi:hypothetical protein
MFWLCMLKLRCGKVQPSHFCPLIFLDFWIPFISYYLLINWNSLTFVSIWMLQFLVVHVSSMWLKSTLTFLSIDEFVKSFEFHLYLIACPKNINGLGVKGGASSHKLMPKTMLWAMEVGGKRSLQQKRSESMSMLFSNMTWLVK